MEMEYANGITRAPKPYDSGTLPSCIFLNQIHHVQVCKDTVWPPEARSLKVAALIHLALRQTLDKVSVPGNIRCTIPDRIPCSDTWIESNQAAVRNVHFPVFRNSNCE